MPNGSSIGSPEGSLFYLFWTDQMVNLAGG
jgi:hypothetical protein